MSVRWLAATVGALLALLVSPSLAVAHWTGTGSGTGNAATGTFTAATISAPSTSNGTTVLSITQQATLPQSAGHDSSIAYVVERRTGAGAFAAVAAGGCSGTKPVGTTTCTDTTAGTGNHAYRVVASTGTWTATSNTVSVAVTDTTGPSVTAVTTLDASPTAAGSVRYAVTFSESVTGVNAADFTVVRGGTISTGAVVTNVTGSGTERTVTVSTGTGSGSLRLDVADDDTITDAAGNRLGGTGAGNGTFSGSSYTVDRTAPTVTSITRAGTSPTSNASVQFTVTFSEPVTGVGVGDFSLAASGVSGASITSSSPGSATSSTTFTVTAATGSGSGTLGLNLVDDDSVADGVGNVLGGTGAGNGSLVGASYSLDRSAPALTAATIAKAEGRPGSSAGAVRRSGQYYVYATVTDPAGVATVTASLTALGGGGSVALSPCLSSCTVNGVTYGYVSAAQTASGTLSGSSASYTLAMTDELGNSGPSTPQSVAVDNVAPAPSAIATANAPTGTPGLIEQGDTLTFTYTEPMDANSLLSSWLWDWSTAADVAVAVADAGGYDLLQIVPPSRSPELPFGTINLTSDAYITSAPATYVVYGTLASPSKMTRSGNTVTVTLGPYNAPDSTGVQSPTPVSSTGTGVTITWSTTAGSGVYDAAGNPVAAGTVSNAGNGTTPKRQF